MDVNKKQFQILDSEETKNPRVETAVKTLVCYYLMFLPPHSYFVHSTNSSYYSESATGSRHWGGKQNWSRKISECFQVAYNRSWRHTKTKRWVSSFVQHNSFFILTAILFTIIFCTRNSCGLFVLQCMEHYNGDRFTGEVSQVPTNTSHFFRRNYFCICLLLRCHTVSS